MTTTFPIRYALEGLDEQLKSLLLAPAVTEANPLRCENDAQDQKLATLSLGSRTPKRAADPVFCKEGANVQTQTKDDQTRSLNQFQCTSTPFPEESDDEDVADAHVVAQFIKHVMLRRPGESRENQQQQNVATLANRTLELTEERLDEALGAEVYKISNLQNVL